MFTIRDAETLEIKSTTATIEQAVYYIAHQRFYFGAPKMVIYCNGQEVERSKIPSLRQAVGL